MINSKINETAISFDICATVIVFQAMQIRLLAQSVQLYSQVQSNTQKHLHHTKNVSTVITGYAIMWVCNQCKHSLSGRWSTCNQMTINARTSRWPPNATVNRLCTQCNCTHLSNQHASKCLCNHQSQCPRMCVDAVVQSLLINWFMQSKRIQNACAITKKSAMQLMFMQSVSNRCKYH